MHHSALRRAIEHGNLDAVLNAIDHGADIEEADMHGDPGLPLRIACFKGNAAIVEALIKHGANINARNTQGVGGPIRMAAKGQHRDIVQLLIQHGAEVPEDLKLPPDDRQDRRKGSDRRKSNLGPPSGLKERRQGKDRRVTSVHELALSEQQWEDYFVQPKAASQHELSETAALILDRARD